MLKILCGPKATRSCLGHRAIEDAPNEIREEAKATGIYLSEKKIDVVADRFRITSTAGREIMRADAGGNRVSMENLDVQAGATIGPVEVTETGLAVKAEGEDLQTVISNREFGSLSDALGTGKTSIVALTAPSVSQPGGQFDMGTFSAPDATVRILSVSGRVIMMNGLNSVRIYPDQTNRFPMDRFGHRAIFYGF